MLPLTLPDPAHTLALSECRCHILDKIMSGEPLSPSSPLHFDLALTSAVTGVLGPTAAPWLGRRREAAAMMVQAALPPRPSAPAPITCLQWEGSPAGQDLSFNYQATMVTMGVTCCFF